MAGYIGSKTSVAQVDGYTRTEADAGFVSDPNGAVTVDGSGNVGIGITPSYPLHVSGNAGVTGSTFVGSKFSAATPDYSFLADSSLGMFRLPNVLGFSVAGTERMRIVLSSTMLAVSLCRISQHLWRMGGQHLCRQPKPLSGPTRL